MIVVTVKIDNTTYFGERLHWNIFFGGGLEETLYIELPKAMLLTLYVYVGKSDNPTYIDILQVK